LGFYLSAIIKHAKSKAIKPGQTNFGYSTAQRVRNNSNSPILNSYKISVYLKVKGHHYNLANYI
jgi:hypothetical protein